MSSPPLPKRLKMTVIQNAPPPPPPPLQGPTAKERKYDRQLRLWAANGQAALEDAHILLLSSGPGVVGVETLKNLVLPGIGQFTIVDPASVTETDLGVNFFLDEEDLGKPRAEAWVRLLEELNPDVRGHAITESLGTFLTKPNALQSYTHILTILPLDPSLVSIISQHSETTRIPAFYIHSIGLYSHFTVQLPHAFPIVDTHPDPATTQDLRLLEPWPELAAFASAQTANLTAMDDETHGHIPYVLILLHALDVWKQTSPNNAAPSTYSDKTAFRALVASMARTHLAEGSEENFDEATSAVLKSITPATPSSEARAVLTAPETKSPDPNGSPFWLIAHAVAAFAADNNDLLPLAGSLPDMKATSAVYVALANLYKTKARADAADVLQRVRALESRLNRTASPVAQAEVDAFCKSAAHVRLVRGRPPHIPSTKAASPVKFGAEAASTAVAALTDMITGTPGPACLYIAFLAYDSFCARSGGADVKSSNAVEEISLLADAQLTSLLAEANETDEELASTAREAIHQRIAELVRAQGGELHNISSLTGGMVAQEVIKVVTGQYVPVDCVCVFDGVLSRAGTLRI